MEGTRRFTAMEKFRGKRSYRGATLSHTTGLPPLSSRQNTMAYLTKMQERERFLVEFLRRLREAPPGTRVYMRVALTNFGPLARPRWVLDNDDDERGKTRRGDQAHTAAPDGALLAKRTPRRITRAGWIFCGVVLTPVLLGIAVC